MFFLWILDLACVREVFVIWQMLSITWVLTDIEMFHFKLFSNLFSITQSFNDTGYQIIQKLRQRLKFTFAYIPVGFMLKSLTVHW